MELIPVFDMRKLTDKEINRVQHITELFAEICGKAITCREKDEPLWYQQYHMCKVTTMKRQGYSCVPDWITYVPRNKVRKPSDNVKAYKEGKWTL